MRAPNRHVDGRMISFAQCGEDMVLWRAFSSLRSGFYVDIGANHPSVDSVTKVFYDSGWSGINVEPIATLHEALSCERGRDINLLMGVSDRPGTMTLHINQSNMGLSTFDDKLAHVFRARGARVMDVKVPVITLQELFGRYAPHREIEFLKVDTEGHELAVIRGNDWSRFRPKVVVLEASEASAGQIVKVMESVDYTFTLNDRLNRWFVRNDCFDSLASAVSCPAWPVPDSYHPNVYLEVIEKQREQIGQLEDEARLHGRSSNQHLFLELSLKKYRRVVRRSRKKTRRAVRRVRGLTYRGKCALSRVVRSKIS